MKTVAKVLVAILLVCAIAVFAFVKHFEPDYAFEISSDAVSAPVEVIFDDMAVPHIYAQNEADGMYALGYVHASERLWQMDLLRRAGAGELSALLGEDMIENDKYLRTLGMREAAIRTAEDFENDAPAEIRVAMRAYLDGVNAYIAEGTRPVEYLLVGQEPRPFTIRDVYCSTGFMAYSFAIHLKTEPILDWMLTELGPEYFEDLATGPDGFTRIPVTGTGTGTETGTGTGTGTETGTGTGTEGRDISGLASRVLGLDAERPVPQWLGSNAWVISGERTASGEVLFCNDAHMGYAAPSVWFEAHLQTPEVEYYGNHLAGLPFPAIGHTRQHAWGITMFVNDDIDLYRERIDGDNYLTKSGPHPLLIRPETIEVAGGEDVTFEVRSTHHGPLIEDDIAMWWTFTQYPSNRLHEAFYGFSRNEGLEAFKAAASLVHAPGLNLMYGDKSGDIGWFASAKLPIRPAHVNTKVAIDGFEPANDPQGWYPFERNPQSVNPPSGYVYSANNAPDSVAGVHYPGHYYAGNTRAAGIMAALSTDKSDWTLADAQALQLNDLSPVYRKNAASMLALVGNHHRTELLRGWDGRHSVDDAAPVLYYRWMYRAIEGIVADEIAAACSHPGEAAEKFETYHKTIVSENSFPRILANAESIWWDDVSTPERETPAEILAAALDLAWSDLEAALGPDPAAWRYGTLHTVTHKHAMTDVLGAVFDVGPFEVPAAKDALNKYEFKLKKEVDFEVFSGPSMRIGIDFADVDAAESILPTGQSGNVFSPFYDNQAPLYHAGAFRSMRMDREDIEAHATGTARILPRP